jgi:primosomal protein N' (replication factor Y)
VARFAEVAVPIPVDQTFTYLVPDRLQEQIRIGQRVTVPFGPRSVTGFVVDLPETCSFPKLKPLRGLVHPEPMVDSSMLRLTRWMADRYLCSWGEALEAAVPAAVRRGKTKKTEQRLYPAAGAAEAIEELQGGRTRSQAEVLSVLLERGGGLTAAELGREVGVSRSPIDSLLKRGLIVAREEGVDADVMADSLPEHSPPTTLTEHQAQALDQIGEAIDAGTFRGIVLHGVTGSGKTEVYLRAIERVVAAGKQAIVLVPEIALTPQTVRRFSGRFDRVAVLHSHLSEGDRAGEWEDIRAGKVQVVVGARSAIFAPLPDPGLLVMDEEHENTYKQSNAPRYHAREVMIERARAHGIPAIFGTATPSLEVFYRLRDPEFTLVEMPERVSGFPMPEMDVVDFREHKITAARELILSHRLELLMRETLARGEQVFLFLNRRGFHSSMVCRQCGWIGKCKDCDVSLTVHRERNKALCHFCDRSYAIWESCPDCGFEGVRAKGMGTERVEDLVRTIFPGVSVIRMDSDAMSGKKDYTDALTAIGTGEAQIVVGTQMIAKGLDFPNVTLVGIILADIPFAFPDFRSAERVFQLVVQVAGRAGRSPKGGRVVIQTFRSDHYALKHAARLDYLTFAEEELQERGAASYPPFSTMIRIVGQGKKLETVTAALGDLAAEIRAVAPEGTRITPVLPAPIQRMKGEDRAHFQILSREGDATRSAIQELLRGRRKPRGVTLTIDVDPFQML